MDVVNESDDIASVGHREPAQGEVEEEIKDKGKHCQPVPGRSHMKTASFLQVLLNWNANV